MWCVELGRPWTCLHRLLAALQEESFRLLCPVSVLGMLRVRGRCGISLPVCDKWGFRSRYFIRGRRRSIVSTPIGGSSWRPKPLVATEAAPLYLLPCPLFSAS